MSERIVAVAGANGFVGRHIVSELLRRGHQVRALVRSRDKAGEALGSDGRLRLILGEATSADAAAGLTAGVSAIINAVGIIREGGGDTFRKAHVLTTRSLVEAAQAGAGPTPPRFVQISALGVGDEGKTEYQRTKFEAEMIVRRSGLPWTILRPSLIHGPDNGLMRLIKGWVTGEKQPWFFLPYFTRGEITSDVPLAALHRIPASLQPVAGEEVARAAAESLERPQAIGEVINLVGPETLTWPELLESMQAAVPGADMALRPLGISAEFAAAQARVARALGLGGLLPFDEGMALMGSQDSTAGADKAAAVLGFRPAPFTPAMRQYAHRL